MVDTLPHLPLGIVFHNFGLQSKAGFPLGQVLQIGLGLQQRQQIQSGLTTLPIQLSAMYFSISGCAMVATMRTC